VSSGFDGPASNHYGPFTMIRLRSRFPSIRFPSAWPQTRVPGRLVAVLLFGLTFPGLAAVKSSVQVTDLRCEYLKNPLGLDVAQPRLSWKPVPTNPKDRGQGQTAYRILVAGTAETMAKPRGDRWDSGEVPSDQNAHVVDQGQRLLSRHYSFKADYPTEPVFRRH